MRLLPLLVLLLLVLGTVGVTALAVRQPFPTVEATVAQARRHARRLSRAGLAAGIVAALAVGVAGNHPWTPLSPAVGQPGVTALSMPLAFGLAYIGALLVGELTWPKPAGHVRRARLVRRRLLDSVPRWLLLSAEGTLGGGLLLATAGALVARPDGRTITVSIAGDGGQGAASPFAGADYGLPMAGGLAILAGITVFALWVVAERPALGTADEQVESMLRRASAHRILRSATAAAFVSVGGLLAVSGFSLRSAATLAVEEAMSSGLAVGVLGQSLPWLGVLLGGLGVLGVLGGVGLLFVRAPRSVTDVPVPVAS